MLAKVGSTSACLLLQQVYAVNYRPNQTAGALTQVCYVVHVRVSDGLRNFDRRPPSPRQVNTLFPLASCIFFNVLLKSDGNLQLQVAERIEDQSNMQFLLSYVHYASRILVSMVIKQDYTRMHVSLDMRGELKIEAAAVPERAAANRYRA